MVMKWQQWKHKCHRRAPSERRKVVFGGMKDRVRLLPGWDDPIELEDLLI
jgi:hypothetical protein